MAKRVLVVDGDLDILEILREILSTAGFNVSTFRLEQGVFQKIVDEQPDAIVLDVIRPTSEGAELCNAIKAFEPIKHIPVIVLSTHLKASGLKEICADEVISKPFDIDEVVEVIQSQLALAQNSR